MRADIVDLGTSPASRRARMVAAALGVCVGISGLDHGLFEILQGNRATPGPFIAAIGPEQLMWVNGTEDAFTLVPNFLVTGILSVVVGLAMILWSVRSVDRPDGSRVFLALGLLLFLVGGGIGMLVFLLVGWLVARRIHRLPALWTSALPASLDSALDRVRLGLIAGGFVLYAVALEIAIVGFVPGTSDPDVCLTVCWMALLAMMGLFVLALFGAPEPERRQAAARA
jgi:hypothetical protein